MATEQIENIATELAGELQEISDNNTALSRLVIESINESLNQTQPNQFLTLAAREQSAKTNHLYNLQKRSIGLKTVREEEEEEDYENQDTNRKERESKDDFKVISKTIDKFKLLGYNSKGWPIYRATDVYYASDPYIQKIYEDKINALTKNQRPRKNKQHKEDAFNNLLEKWKNRENDEFYDQDKDEIDQQELKDMVADMGEKRENFFLYYKDYKQSTQKYFQPKQISYSPFNSCDFLNNFNKAVLQRKQQYMNVQEFQEQKQDERAEIFQFDNKTTNKVEKFWGENNVEEKELMKVKSKVFTIQDELTNPTSMVTNPTSQNLTAAILKEHSFINSEVVEEKYKLPLESLQRIEIDLSNPNFFLKKVNLGVAKRGEEVYFKASDISKSKINLLSEDVRGIRAEQQSALSQSSRHTGGPTVSLKPISDSLNIMEPTGLQSFDNLIIEKIKLQTQKKTGLYHSEVANKLMFPKFKLEPKDFMNYHRFNYPWRKHDNIQLNVTVVKAKSVKIKGQFLELNTQKQESHVKFSNFSSLSLATGDYIAVENIEESPLIMSNIGMCSKMYLQINPKPVINQMNTQLYKERQFQQLEEAREKTHLYKQNLTDNCASWRKIITQNLGPNGKLYIGTENSSLLIGSPEGMGVAVLESNLSSVPVVKQKNNPRDFILVRQGGNWYIRKIDNIYVSGQVEPKMEVFQPDSRNIVNFNVSFFKSFAKKRFEKSSSVHIEEFKQTFSIFNEHNIRRNLKEIGARTKDSKHYMGSDDKEVDFDVTPEQICQYQKMQNNLYNLQGLGIVNLKTPDKLKQIITTFFKKYPDDLTKFAFSKFISDELHLTSWYLSESFLSAEQEQSKIELIGLGDPTNGHGGYSYIKKPQKQRVEKEEVIDKKVDKKVSGTEFDLRKLKTVDIEKLLIERGKKKEDFQGLSRWPKINMLKKIGGDEYQRPERHNKSKKKQSEKRQINGIFNKMLKNLSPYVEIPQVNTNTPDTVGIEYYINRQKPNWDVRRDKLFNQSKMETESVNNNEGDEDEDDEQGEDVDNE